MLGAPCGELVAVTSAAARSRGRYHSALSTRQGQGFERKARSTRRQHRDDGASSHRRDIDSRSRLRIEDGRQLGDGMPACATGRDVFGRTEASTCCRRAEGAISAPRQVEDVAFAAADLRARPRNDTRSRCRGGVCVAAIAGRSVAPTKNVSLADVPAASATIDLDAVATIERLGRESGAETSSQIADITKREHLHSEPARHGEQLRS